jgi:hypothetical protein
MRKKFQNIKSHDCHVIMRQLLPIELRGLLLKHVRVLIVKLHAFLNAISQQTPPPPPLWQNPLPPPLRQKRKSTAAPAASTTTAKKSSSAKKSSAAKKDPTKLPYEMTDEKNVIIVAADMKCQLAPKQPPPKQYIPPGKVKNFAKMVERPRPNNCYQTMIALFYSHIMRMLSSREVVVLAGKQLRSSGTEKTNRYPLSTFSLMMIRRRHD